MEPEIVGSGKFNSIEMLVTDDDMEVYGVLFKGQRAQKAFPFRLVSQSLIDTV